jgi:hypothetical protein
MRAAKILWGLLVLLGFFLVASLIWFLNSDYEELLLLATTQLNRPDLYETLKQQYFTADKFETIRGLTYVLLPAFLIGLGFLIYKGKRIVSILRVLFQRVGSYIRSFYIRINESSTRTKIILGSLLIFVLARSVYLALHYYPQYDECWNYNYFLSNNPLTSVMAYNNYPLHNLLTYATLSIFPDHTFFLRLPNIILGVLAVLLVFGLVKTIFKNENIALVVAAIFSALPVVLFYMLFARGVMLSMVFALILLFFFFVKQIKNWDKVDIFCVGLIGALGCYAMISFPIFVIVLWLCAAVQYIKQTKVKALLPLLFAGLWLGVFTLVLYSPMLLGSGLGPGLSSGYMKTGFNFASLLSTTDFISRNQIGFYRGAIIFILLNIVSLFFSKRKEIILLNLLLLALPYLLFLIGISLPARALSFQFIAYLFSLILLLEIIKNKTSQVGAVIIGILFCLAFHYTSLTHTFLGWSAKRDQGAHEIATVLHKNKLTSLYDLDGSFGYFVPGLQYYFKVRNKNLNFRTNNRTSTRFQDPNQQNGIVFVTETRKYDAKLTDEILFRYQDEAVDFTIYQRKK